MKENTIYTCIRLAVTTILLSLYSVYILYTMYVYTCTLYIEFFFVALVARMFTSMHELSHNHVSLVVLAAQRSHEGRV